MTNTNYVGAHFGGSLYSMCDPIYMFLLMEHLGKDYIVWDKSATIHFLRPGRGKVIATFRVSPQEIEDIRSIIKKKRKMDWIRQVKILDEDGNVVAELEKTIYIRRAISSASKEDE